MADGPGHYGSGNEDLEREIAALDAIKPKVEGFNKRRQEEIDATDRSIGKLKGEAKAREEVTASIEKQAAAIGKLTAAQSKLLGQAVTAGEARGTGNQRRTAESLVRQGLLTTDSPQGRGPYQPTDVGAVVARERNLISRVAVEAASRAAAVAKTIPSPAAAPQQTAQRDAVTREAIAAERDLAAAARESAAATRQEVAARNATARRQLATEGAALGTLGVFATGAGAALRFGVREQRTGQRVSGNFQTREAAEQRIAQLTQETLGSVQRTANVQRRIAVTAGMELARRERIAAMMVRYESNLLHGQPVIPEGRQIGQGVNHPQSLVRHDLFGQRDYARGTRVADVERTRQEFERLGLAAEQANRRYEDFKRVHEEAFASGRVTRAMRAEHDQLRQNTIDAIQDATHAKSAHARARADLAQDPTGGGHRYNRPFTGPDYSGVRWDIGGGGDPREPRGGMRGQDPAYDRWRDYYAGPPGGPPPPRGPSGEGGTRPGRPTPMGLPQFSHSSMIEEGERHMGLRADSFIDRARAADAAAASTGRYADAEARATAGTRMAAAEFGTADRSMYKHGALTTEFIQAAYRGEVTMRDLGTQVGLTVGKFAGWSVAASLVYGAARAVTTLGNGAMASNSAVAELQRYIGGLDTDRAREQLRALSKDMNVPMDVAATQFAAAARLTGGAGSPRAAQDQAASIARTTLLLSRVGDLDPDTAMKFTSALQTGFRMSADELSLFIDQMNQLQNKMNIPLDVSAGAVSRAAGTWRAAGGSPETLLALTAAARRGTGFTGEILGTTFSRSATMIGRPGNRKQLQAFGIDPDQSVDQIMEQAMRLVETHRVQGRDVIRLGTALSSPQLAGRGVVAALQNTTQYRRAQRLEDPDTARGSAQRELNQMLKSWREEIMAIANDLRQLGGALEQSGLLAPLGMMLKTLTAIGDVVQFLIGGFNNLLPPGLRTGVALLLEAAAAMTVMRRLGAFRAEGALVQHFPQLASLEKPENQIKGLAVRGARDQVEEAERAREGAARSYSSSRIAHEVAVRDLGDMQKDLRAKERGTDPHWLPGGEGHGQLSRDITAREEELAKLEEERAAALRSTINHQKVVKRAKEELKLMEKMTPLEAAVFARATGLPLPASLRIPEERGAGPLKLGDPPRPTYGPGPIGPLRPGEQYAGPIGPLTREEWLKREGYNMGIDTTRPTATERLRRSGLGQSASRFRQSAGERWQAMRDGFADMRAAPPSAFRQRVSGVAQAMRDEIAQMHENLRPKAYVYDPQGASAWNVGPRYDPPTTRVHGGLLPVYHYDKPRQFSSDTSANRMRNRAFELDRFGPSRFDDALDAASRGAFNVSSRIGDMGRSARDMGERISTGLTRGVSALGNGLGSLGRGASAFARNSRVLTSVASLAERSLNAAITGVEAGLGGLKRMSGGIGKLWGSLGALDKVFIGFLAFQVTQSLTDPSRNAIQQQYEAARKLSGPRDQRARQQLARRRNEGLTGHDLAQGAVADFADYLHPSNWIGILTGAGDYKSSSEKAYDARQLRNRQNDQARGVLAQQRREAAAGKPLTGRFSGDIARDARRLMAEQATFTNAGDYNQRMQKLQQEAEKAAMEGRNPKERERSKQRLAQVMAELAASSNDTLAVRRQIATLDEAGVQKAGQTAIANVQAYGMHGTRSRQYLMMAREAYLRAVQQEGRGTPEQLAALAQLRDQFFQGIAQTAQTDLAIALDAAGADPSKRAAAFGQERKDVYGQTVGTAKRSLDDARGRRTSLINQRDAARAGAQFASSVGDTGMARRMQSTVRDLNSRIEAVNVEIGKRGDEVELMERAYKAWQIDEKQRAFDDRSAGRQRRADLRSSRTDDPLVQAREQTRRAQANLSDARSHFGAGSTQAQEAETARNQAINAQFQAHLQDIQSEGRLRVSEGPRDTVSRARKTLDEARRALAYAALHKAAHPVAYREALVTVNEAENSLSDAVRSRAQSIVDLRGQLAVARAHGDPMEAARQALIAAQQLTRDPTETAQQFALRRAVAFQNAVNQGQDARRDLHAAQGEFRSSVSGDPRDQARAELENAQSELRDATAGTAAWWRARAHVNTARRQIQQADADMASARLELRKAGTDDPVAQARIDEQIARQALRGTTGAERLRARARLRDAHRNTLQTSVTARSDTVDFNLAMEKITADQAAAQLESLARAHGIGRSMRRDLLRRAHDLRKQSEQEAGGFALDVGTIKLPTIYDVRRAMAPLRQGADMGASARMHAVTNMNLTINAGDGPGAEERVYAGVDRAMGTAIRATMRSAQMR